jgi:uncharacterized protein with NAD-binding domain and iron-sulfur cluster
MSRIPYGGQLHGVLDNLVMATQVQIARTGQANDLVAPAQFPQSMSDWEATLRFALQYATHMEVPLDEQIHFVGLLSDLMSACDARRFGQYEQQSWWEFSGAQSRSANYQKLLADGLTRSLVAARAHEMSARTGGYILLQLLQDMATPGGQVDRVLSGPTSDVWIDPWLAELERLGVDYRLRSRVDAIHSNGGHVTGITVQPLDAAGNPEGPAVEESADQFVAALPVEVLRERIAMDDLRRTCPALAGLDTLQVRWMNGIMYYLGHDVPLVHGHTLYIDSPWALTSISQRQFWPRTDLRAMGDGTVGGLLSVDISDWDTPGASGRAARSCSAEEVATEVWDQLKAALNDGDEVLADANRLAWFLDPDIVFPNPSEAMNLEPLLVNTAGSWKRRPAAELPEVDNLFLASDYVQTYTDLATMEGANEAARRAVNGILDATGSTDERCGVWKLREPGGLAFRVAREADAVLYRVFGAGHGPPPTVVVKDGRLETNPVSRLAGAIRWW